MPAANRDDDGGRSVIDRRFALQALLAAAIAWRPALAAQAAADPAGPARLLLDELNRIEARSYSEEGIPMFLACENLADAVSYEPSAMNRELAAAYRGYAELLPGLEREMTEYDAANLVELLALRDFEAGGR